jgi:hypothetical protein
MPNTPVPTYQSRQKALDRRSAWTSMLLKQGMEKPSSQGQMAGRFFVPPNPYEGLNKTLQQAVMLYGMSKGRSDQDTLDADLARSQAASIQPAVW